MWEMFITTATKVLMMVAYGVPGYILVKTKLVGGDSAKVFAKLLLYVCSPALCVQSINSVLLIEDKPPISELLVSAAIFFVAVMVAQIAVILAYTAIFKKQVKTDMGHRVCAIASGAGNVGFFGVPLLKFLFPENLELVLYSALFSITMNIIGWTLGLLLMTGNKKYITAKAIFLNPSVIAFIISMLLFAANMPLPSILGEYVNTLGTLSTFVCMTVLGMRMATKKLSNVFLNRRVYKGAISKLFVFPFIILGIFALLPVGDEVRHAAFVLGCCPAATTIQGLAESFDGDSETAANVILFTSITCIITIPLMWTFYNSVIL